MRMTMMSLGFTGRKIAESTSHLEIKAQTLTAMNEMGDRTGRRRTRNRVCHRAADALGRKGADLVPPTAQR